MREKAEIFFDAITGIREELVEEAQDYAFRRRWQWRRYVPLAACLALAACLGWFSLFLFGGSGGNSDMTANNAAPPTASMDSAPREPAPGDAFFGNAGDSGGSESGSPVAPPVEREFTARVVELREDGILVRPLPGGDLPGDADRAEVSLKGLEELPDLQVGDKIEVVFTGELAETYPVQITNVTEIILVE